MELNNKEKRELYVLISVEIDEKSKALENFKNKLQDDFTKNVIEDYTKEIQLLKDIKSKLN